jgi:hypothetical protein
MTLEDKIENAKAFIKSTLATYSKPVCMSSFGKDSQVLLHILKTMGVKLPLLQHRDSWANPCKYKFADAQILAEGYVVHDYKPSGTSITTNGDKVEITSHYQVGENATIWLGKDIETPEEGKPFHCGLDIYHKPCGGNFTFLWDLCIVGHKSSDVDPIQGAVPLKVDLHIPQEGPAYAYPLRYFTDTDAWAYIERFSVPYNSGRYDKENGYKEFKNLDQNDDHYHACTKCMLKTSPSLVFCPKYQKVVANISSTICHKEAPVFEYMDSNGTRK